jgi:hypothetical protein
MMVTVQEREATMIIGAAYSREGRWESAVSITSNALRVVRGHASLVLCFLLYLFWWWVFFSPRIGALSSGLRTAGILSIIGAFVFGLAGLVICISALFAIPSDGCLIKPWQVGVFGAVAYGVLLYVTATIFKRQVTSELLIEVVWFTLELAVIDELVGAGVLKIGASVALAVLLCALFVLGLVCYLKFYQLEGNAAFVCGAIPLVCAVVHGLVMALAITMALG